MRTEMEEKNPDPKYGKKSRVSPLSLRSLIFHSKWRRNGNNDCNGWMGVDLMDLMQIGRHPHPPQPGYSLNGCRPF